MVNKSLKLSGIVNLPLDPQVDFFIATTVQSGQDANSYEYKGHLADNATIDFSSLADHFLGLVGAAGISAGWNDSFAALPTLTFERVELAFIPNQSIQFLVSKGNSLNRSSPYTILPGIELNNFLFNLNVEKRASNLPNSASDSKSGDSLITLCLTGQFTISDSRISASLFFSENKPVLLLAESLDLLRVSDLFNQFFQSGKVTWPEDFIDITFRDNRIYFYRQKNKAGHDIQLPSALSSEQLPFVLRPGFNIQSTITFSLAETELPAFDVNVNIQQADQSNQDNEREDQRVVISGTLQNPIVFVDKGFLQVLGTGYRGGPSLEVITSNNRSENQFEFVCSFEFFKTAFGESTLRVSQKSQSPDVSSSTANKDKDQVLEAELHHDGKIGPFNDPRVAFSWSKTSGFKIHDFPYIDVPDVNIDFIKSFKEISTSVCQELAGLAFKELKPTADFSVSPSITTTKPLDNVGDGLFYVLIEGQYTILAVGEAVVTVDLPKLALSFNTPDEFSFDSIAEQIGQTITNNAYNVVAELWSDREQATKFMLVFCTQQALEQVVKKMTQATADLACKAFGEFLKNALQAFLDALARGLTAIKAISKLASDDDDDDDDNDDDDDDKEGSDSGTDDAVPLRLPAPTGINYSCSYETGGIQTITVSWNSVPGANLYKIVMLDALSNFVTKDSIIAGQSDSSTKITTKLELPNLDQIPAGECRLIINALPSIDSMIGGYFTRFEVTKLKKPENAFATYDIQSNRVNVSWDHVSEAAQYRAAVENLVKREDVWQTSIPNDRQDYQISASVFSEVGDYTVGIRAQATDQSISSSLSHTAQLTVLAPPESVTQEQKDEQLQINWRPISGATSYSITVIQLESEDMAAYETVPANALTERKGWINYDLSLNKFNIRSPGRYQASVVAIGNKTHISSSPQSSSSVDWLFRGIGFAEIGNSFTVG